MNYMLLICQDEDVVYEDPDKLQAETWAWVEQMSRRGVRLSGNRLRPPSDATTVRVRGDEVLLSDGPFAEAKEQIAGYDVLECSDLDEALEVAAAHPMARIGTIEVRPFWPL